LRYADQLIARVALLIVVFMLPLPATLPRAGHRVLAILAFAVG
jgi:sodium-dependent dicarboxylate transporter 2/3/5